MPAFMMVVVVKADTKMSSRSYCVCLSTIKKSQNTKSIFFNPYPANIFVLKMSSAYPRLLQIFKCAPENFLNGSKCYESSLDCSLRSSLIWVYIVCNIGYQISQADERADENCHVWREKG